MAGTSKIRWSASLLRELIEVLFPRTCPLCGKEGSLPWGSCVSCSLSLGIAPSWRCPVCGDPLGMQAGNVCCPTPKSFALTGLFSAVEYGTTARTLIHRFKYGKHAPSGKTMSEILSSSSDRYLDIPCHGIVPVPLAPRKIKKRGFNQAALLARHLGKRLSLPVSFNVLTRFKETPSQTGFDPGGRARNMRGAFKVNTAAALPGTVILLVDDIYTTGATMNECARTLRQAGATEIFGVVFACVTARDTPGRD